MELLTPLSNDTQSLGNLPTNLLGPEIFSVSIQCDQTATSIVDQSSVSAWLMMPTSSTAIVGDQPSKAEGTSDESVAVEKVEAGDEGQPQQETEQQLEYPSGPRFWVIVFALCLVGFLISLVRNFHLY